ncbi:MCE family protein [Mycolicibacterium fluoranthenivorans]|uniref:Virulence factor Mce-like protein n=1 Tax=Mycolicibacterium fluoranthenivorans TaxID=258505 RepID=A0A7X5U2L9_9MYCO|nr:MCE family protein [Mycolicibacterium fluoranthenivorans]MCV7354144.1 MCE family protein [Mycolicibacterium fluoranthenivorans]NIH97293.1 virulence factor Mce-like protein [Mycolicibacterium fluoranthenivorans]
MNVRSMLRRTGALCSALMATAGCAFQGLNSLPLPGAVGRSSDALVYHLAVANVGTLEPNSPVLVDDVVVGSVRAISVVDWHADIEVSLRPDVVVPANVVARVGQTSLLGSMHVALDPPVGQQAQGRLDPGTHLPLTRSASYPSTERTLSTLSTVVNAGGLGQIGSIVHDFTLALGGHAAQTRDVLSRLNDLVTVFDEQRDEMVGAIQAMDRLATTLADQQPVISRALDVLPGALDVLNGQRQQLVTALDHMRRFSDTTTGLVQDSGDDLVADLQHLEPTIRALADVGPEIDTALAFLPVMPFGQNLIDRGIKGDYMNLFAVFDLTVPRLKRTLFAGTRWGDENVHIVPAPGDPGFDAYYSSNPLMAPLDPPPPDPVPAPKAGG